MSGAAAWAVLSLSPRVGPLVLPPVPTVTNPGLLHLIWRELRLPATFRRPNAPGEAGGGSLAENCFYETEECVGGHGVAARRAVAGCAAARHDQGRHDRSRAASDRGSGEHRARGWADDRIRGAGEGHDPRRGPGRRLRAEDPLGRAQERGGLLDLRRP